jgi:hypothetical protein
LDHTSAISATCSSKQTYEWLTGPPTRLRTYSEYTPDITTVNMRTAASTASDAPTATLRLWVKPA